MIEAPPYAPPHAPYLSIAYLDEEMIVADKPSGLLSVPGKPPDMDDCVETRAKAAFDRAFIIHRLDMATSGLILLARTKAAQRCASAQFEAREIAKTYHAVTARAPDGDEGEIDLPLITDWPNRPRQKVCHETGKPSLTHWRVEARIGGGALLRLTPKTGRSHQLRVHLMSIGCPIVGDALYGGGLEEAPRLMLHASRIGWRKTSGEYVEVSSPPSFSAATFPAADGASCAAPSEKE